VDVLANLLGLLVRLVCTLLARNLDTVLLGDCLALVVRHLDELLFLHILTVVILIVLAGARHLHPLFTSVPVRLPP